MQKTALIKALESLGGLRLGRYLHRHRPMVLMYHRVQSDPLLGGISPEVFAQQLAYVKRCFRVVGINQLLEELIHDQLQPYSLALTFDDGHSDFYSQAWPLLQRYQLPASLYVTTDFIDRRCWLWPDLLRHQLLKTTRAEVHIQDLGRVPLGQEVIAQSWSRLGDHCLTLAPEQRSAFLRELGEALGVAQPQAPQAPFCPVTWEQLREMHRQGLDVGSHSVSHPILSSLPEADLRYELEHSRQRLLEELGEAPKGICYPNGMARDVSERVETLAAERYQYGLVAYPRPVSPERLMRLGRWAAPNSFTRFKQSLSGLSRNDNYQGEYR